MSVFAGPSISTNGLVFHYDMSNTQKSWVGAPTTNLISDPYALAGNPSPLALSGYEATNTRTTTLPLSDMANISSTWFVSTKTTSTNGRVFFLSVGSLSTMTDYSFSMYAYTQDANISRIICSTDNSVISPIKTELGYNISNRGTIQRINCVFTSTNGGQSIGVRVGNADPVGSTFYFTGIQVESQSFPTPIVNGTRSTTSSVIDLTRNNVITATSLTYLSSGTFSFNGSSDFLRPNITHSYLSSSSLEVWFRSTSHGGAGVKKTIFGYSHNEGFSYPTIGSIYLENNNLSASVITASQVYRTVTAASTISTSTWYHAVLNKDTINGTLNLYLNGVLSGTQTFDPVSYGQWTTTGTFIGVNVLDIGKSTNNSVGQGWSTAYFSGSIPVAKVYSRVLTDAEIQSNFNATRSRFGL
jgi:hypothetical protein